MTAEKAKERVFAFRGSSLLAIPAERKQSGAGTGSRGCYRLTFGWEDRDAFRLFHYLLLAVKRFPVHRTVQPVQDVQSVQSASPRTFYRSRKGVVHHAPLLRDKASDMPTLASEPCLRNSQNNLGFLGLNSVSGRWSVA